MVDDNLMNTNLSTNKRTFDRICPLEENTPHITSMSQLDTLHKTMLLYISDVSYEVDLFAKVLQCSNIYVDDLIQKLLVVSEIQRLIEKSDKGESHPSLIIYWIHELRRKEELPLNAYTFTMCLYRYALNLIREMGELSFDEGVHFNLYTPTVAIVVEKSGFSKEGIGFNHFVREPLLPPMLVFNFEKIKELKYKDEDKKQKLMKLLNDLTTDRVIDRAQSASYSVVKLF